MASDSISGLETGVISGEHLLFRETTSTNAVSLRRLQINPAQLGSPHPRFPLPWFPPIVQDWAACILVVALLPLFRASDAALFHLGAVRLAKRKVFVHLVPSPGRCLSPAREICLGRTTDSHRATARGSLQPGWPEYTCFVIY